MHRRDKIDQARFYLRKLQQLQEAPPTPENTFEFRALLSGLLAVSRSPLQYCYEEANDRFKSRDDRSALDWYRSWINRSTILQDFKRVRDTDIHRRPARPTQQINIRVHETLAVTLSETAHLKKFDVAGNSIGECDSGELPSPTESPSLTPAMNAPAEVSTRFFFRNWAGPEDVLELAAKYLDEVERVIADGLSKGLITPDGPPLKDESESY